MRKNFFPLAWAVCLCLQAAQAQPTAKARAQYAAINRDLGKYQVVRRDLVGYSAEGGKLTVYLQGGEPQKLVADYYGETGRATEEFYFRQNRLFFVLRTESRYQFPIGMAQSPGRVTRSEGRFYFKNGRLTHRTGSDNKQLSVSQLAQSQKDLLAMARRLLAELRKRS